MKPAVLRGVSTKRLVAELARRTMGSGGSLLLYWKEPGDQIRLELGGAPEALANLFEALAGHVDDVNKEHLDNMIRTRTN